MPFTLPRSHRDPSGLPYCPFILQFVRLERMNGRSGNSLSHILNSSRLLCEKALIFINGKTLRNRYIQIYLLLLYASGDGLLLYYVLLYCLMLLLLVCCCCCWTVCCIVAGSANAAPLLHCLLLLLL